MRWRWVPGANLAGPAAAARGGVLQGDTSPNGGLLQVVQPPTPTFWCPLQVDTVEHVRWLFDRVKGIAGERLAAAGAPPPALVTMCESGMGLLNLRCVLSAAADAPSILFDSEEGLVFVLAAFMRAAAQGSAVSGGSTRHPVGHLACPPSLPMPSCVAPSSGPASAWPRRQVRRTTVLKRPSCFCAAMSCTPLRP